MARFKVYLSTSLVNSRVEREFEIDDEDLDGLGIQERNDLVEAYAKEELWNLFDWNWEADPGNEN